MAELQTLESLESTVRQAVADVTITDVHTHLFPPSQGKLLLWGPDELLTYHYLVAELFTVAPAGMTTEAFWKASKAQQADWIWEHVFLRHGALSEAARGVITTFNRLGLDVAGRDLKPTRAWFAEQTVEGYLRKVFELGGLDYAVMTNDPFQPAEVAEWDAGRGGLDCLKTALRIDTLLMNWPAAAETISAAGYGAAEPNDRSFAEARRFLLAWAKRIDPLYLAASLPPDFCYPADDTRAAVMREVILPVARELGIPMAMMIGVRKRVNPALGDGGDAVGVADVTAVQNLCAENPDVKFLVTMLSRVNQQELCVCARKFGNLHVFGCWWFCNNPSIVEEMTRQRLEMLGANVTLQHSDARVLDQIIYKWRHTRQVVAKVLADKYADAHQAGWRFTGEEIARDVRRLLGGAFEEFLSK